MTLKTRPGRSRPVTTDLSERAARLAVVYQPVNALTPHPQNPRTHSRTQLQQLTDSVRALGLNAPLLINDQNQVLAGHARLQAAVAAGLATVPTVCLGHLNDAQQLAYLIADNRVAELAGWDDAQLTADLAAIQALDLEFDLRLTGFATAEIDNLLLGTASTEPADEVPPLDPDGPAICQPGDLWQLGNHRLLCGDARDPAAYVTLLGCERAQLVFTDPPYNVPIAGHVSGLGAHQHREFAVASGELSSAAFTEFLQSVFTLLAAHSCDGSLHFHCMDWAHLPEILSAGQAVYAEYKQLCVWAKTNAGMGSLYRSQHELVLVFKHGRAAHINNIQLGSQGRYRSNLWSYPGCNSFGAERDAALAMHPTVKPVRLVADVLRDASRPRGWVLDAFGGSGTTLIAAEQTNRRAALLEIDPRYSDLTLRRWHGLTGEQPVHVASGQTWARREAGIVRPRRQNRKGS